MIALVAFTRGGCALGRSLAQELGGALWTSQRLSVSMSLPSCGDLQSWTGERFRDSQALIFISASGIAVRAIAPFVKDKFSDPAVVSVDEAGQFVVPLLSGHVGGANDLARRVAALTGGQAVVSTATDVNGLFAVDQWAREQKLVLWEREKAKAVSAALLEGKPVAVRSVYPISGAIPRGLREEATEFGIIIGPTARECPFPQTLHLIPRAVTLGIGCRRGTGQSRLEAALEEFLDKSAIPAAAIRALATIDLKQDEPGLLAFAEAHGWPITFFTAGELAMEQGDFPPSAFVEKTTGVDNVCQRAAQRAGGTIVIPKTVCQGVTFAAAMGEVTLTWEE